MLYNVFSRPDTHKTARPVVQLLFRVIHGSLDQPGSDSKLRLDRFSRFRQLTAESLHRCN